MNESPEQINFDFGERVETKEQKAVSKERTVEKEESKVESSGECKQCGNEFDSAGGCWSCLGRPEKDKYRAA